MKKMTYLEMVQTINKALNVAIDNGVIENVEEVANALEKLEQFEQTQINKANYNATRKSNRKSRVSEETLLKAKAIENILKVGIENALTGNELSEMIKEFDLTPLAISNAIKYIDNVTVEKTKKVVEIVNTKGLTRQAEHTAYYIKG